MITLKQKAKEARLKVLDMTFKAQSSHIGSNFSVIDIMTVLFDSLNYKKDLVILSAGWKAASFYYFLAKAGFFPEEDLLTYNQEGSKLIGLTEPGVPGVLFAGGSMQLGIPAAVGFALSKKLSKQGGKVYCICSDGEMAGGMVWESLAIAAHHHLDNMILIVDYNGLQAMGKGIDILDMRPLEDKIRAFRWNVVNVNGHDFDMMQRVLYTAQKTPYPTVILAHTVKGKGWKRAENNNLYHYKNLSLEEYEEAKQELL